MQNITIKDLINLSEKLVGLSQKDIIKVLLDFFDEKIKE